MMTAKHKTTAPEEANLGDEFLAAWMKIVNSKQLNDGDKATLFRSWVKTWDRIVADWRTKIVFSKETAKDAAQTRESLVRMAEHYETAD